MRKHKVDKINLQVDSFLPFKNESHKGVTIEWSSDIGWGEYTIYKEKGSNEWFADSECMDSNEDKEFITELMRLFIEKLIIE